jgi:hypothetical protein
MTAWLIFFAWALSLGEASTAVTILCFLAWMNEIV